MSWTGNSGGAGGGGAGFVDISKGEDSAASSGDAGYPVLAQRQDGDGTGANADGDYVTLKTNSLDRLKVSALPADTAATTGSITANGGIVACDVRRQGTASLIITAGTFAGITLAFEASDDSTNGTDGTWVSILGARSNANTIENNTGSLSAAPAYGHLFGVAAWAWIRVRATSFTSGSMPIVWKPGALATEPAQASQPLPTGTNSIGNIGTVSTVTTVTNVTNNVNVVQKTTTTGGTSNAKSISAATTNATLAKASAGQVYGIQFANNGAAWAYVKLYNKASAPTVGTDIPVEIYGIPPGGAREVNRPLGMPFSTGISFAITGGAADSDTTAVAANQVVGSIQYA